MNRRVVSKLVWPDSDKTLTYRDFPSTYVACTQTATAYRPELHAIKLTVLLQRPAVT
jgi:hypothetical protein